VLESTNPPVNMGIPITRHINPGGLGNSMAVRWRLGLVLHALAAGWGRVGEAGALARVAGPGERGTGAPGSARPSIVLGGDVNLQCGSRFFKNLWGQKISRLEALGQAT